MESLTKRILAIVLIAIIGTGIGLGAYFFLLAPGAGDYQWSASDAPGAPGTINSSQIIKIGCAGDIGEIQGDGNWEGAYLAAKHINEAGGVDVGGMTYYVGITTEDTDESNPNLVTSRGVTAARRLIYNKKVDFGVGGFRSEALLAYQEEFMDAEIIFIDTGASTDIFCENVNNSYSRYKYFFRFMPINSTSLAGQIIETLVGFILTMNATYPNQEVKQVGILAEDLTWTAGMIGALQYYIPLYTNLTTGGTWEAEILTPIKYDVTLSATDMNTHLASLESQGADIVIPVISGSGGILMMQQYALNMYDYLIFGIDVQSQLDTFYVDSGNSSTYETIMQTLYETNKTATSVAFWNAFKAEFSHEPLYTAVGAYDAVMGIVDAINATQSFDALDIIAEFESWTPSNPHPGVSGEGAWNPLTHDLIAGYPYGYTLWCQWQPGGVKEVIPAQIYTPYAPWLHTANYIVAPWVNATWY
ncbi:MAG: ABC transporter substrate-binding protein [Promethearchaeota archaeon]|jgi:ABC-type branched-subunit amino acid transport system substrate-binding protein